MRSFFLIYGLFVIVACNNETKKEDDKKEDTVQTIQQPPPSPLNDTVFTALGTEPFWALYIINNNKILFHPMNGPDVEVPYVAAKSGPASVQYSSSGNGNNIEVTISKENCSDGMSEENYAYSVLLFVNKERFAGCGRDKP
jgi:uncharacterized membrane protein